MYIFFTNNYLINGTIEKGHRIGLAMVLVLDLAGIGVLTPV